MSEIDELEEAIAKFQAREDRRVDLKRLRVGMDKLECEFSTGIRASQVSGDNLTGGCPTVVTWAGRLCGMSATSVADRLCVGKELESLPKIAEAVRTGEISYQSTALLCHLRDQLGDQREYFVEDEMLEHARNHSVGSLRYLCRLARHIADPDGFFNEAEADFTRRRLEISQIGDGTFCVDAILDPAYLHPHAGAPRLRLHHVAGAARRLAGDRRWQGNPCGLCADTTGAADARSALSLAGV